MMDWMVVVVLVRKSLSSSCFGRVGYCSLAATAGGCILTFVFVMLAYLQPSGGVQIYDREFPQL